MRRPRNRNLKIILICHCTNIHVLFGAGSWSLRMRLLERYIEIVRTRARQRAGSGEYGSMAVKAFPFDYEVPRHLVAQEPLRHRSDARLMVVDRSRQSIEHLHVRDLPRLLPAGDRLVLNDTKVLPAQLSGRRAGTGGRWQGLFIDATPDGHWRILWKTRGRLSPGEVITLSDREGRPGAKVVLVGGLDEGQWLAHPDSEEAIGPILERLGRVPLP